MGNFIIPERTAEDIKEDWIHFASYSPERYKDLCKRERILDEEKQRELKKLDIDKFLDFLMDRPTFESLKIYPENASPAMLSLDKEIIDTLNSLVEVGKKDLPKIRKELGERARIIELNKWGSDIYTEEPRKNGDAMSTGKVEFKVIRAIPVVGPRFFATTVGGYYGFLKYYIEEVARIAPKEANAYLGGTAFLVDVNNKRTASHIIAGSYHDFKKNGEYHVMPIKFYNVEVDLTKKYKIRSKVEKKDRKGHATSISLRVVPR